MATDEKQPAWVDMPAPTIAPLVLALGIVLIFSGPVLSWAMSAAGVVLFVLGIAGWVGQVTSSTGIVKEEVVGEIPRPVVEATGRVETLRPGMAGYRARLPEKVHPYSAGLKGGIVGGILMPIPAVVFGLIAYRSVLVPINLLAGMVLPDMVDETLLDQQQIEYLKQFDLGWFLVALFMHAVISMGLGLMYGVLLPTLPGRPIFWGGVVLPLLWTGFSYGFMGVLNPVLQEYVNWPFFIMSQLIYGIATSVVVARSEKIPVWKLGDVR